jgi:hypothetical protein
MKSIEEQRKEFSYDVDEEQANDFFNDLDAASEHACQLLNQLERTFQNQHPSIGALTIMVLMVTYQRAFMSGVSIEKFCDMTRMIYQLPPTVDFDNSEATNAH